MTILHRHTIVDGFYITTAGTSTKHSSSKWRLNDISNEKRRDKKTAILIVDHGSRVAEANDMLLVLTEKYKEYSMATIVEAAHMEMAEPSILTAVKRCVDQGADHIICHPFFLSKGRHVKEDIPSLMASAAEQYSITYNITEPLGLQEGIVNLIDVSISRTSRSLQ